MKNPNKRRLVLRILLIVLLTAHLCVIFHFSNEAAPQSDQTSTSFIETVLQRMVPSFSNLSPDARAQRVQSLQKSVRTLAHMAEFAWLGALLCALGLTFTKRPLLLVGVPAAALIALLDEAHQLLVPGRTFQWEDVGVDVGGAALGMAALWLLWRLGVRVIHAIQRKKENSI